ncbi:hypothetical protein NNJEOMEG_03617 [Fundidesulfovibrio magnetotacticus]|uniref:DUF2867 domain-containing protein n=1 Tax=Fundidesulfovibrio magnetotacticus TaxID=2730080 RepID=A0A6V8M0H9_9BACT|nr:DUF2867 domain-containing protein [Fundidesulfovibrio magnetotacticus]GFK95749.1 hypothetical protein NNJEOMEG_03617 [Fundidesulfovibrio magnetotacticus]
MNGQPSELSLPPEVLEAVGAYDFADQFAAASRKEIRRYLADFLSYRPWWLRALFALRAPLARLLGIRHAFQPDAPTGPESIPFEPGGMLWIFRTVAAREGSYWAGEADDAHLRAVLAVTADTLEGGARGYRVMTFVRFKNWRGPLYFRLVRPFHSLVVGAKTRRAA